MDHSCLLQLKIFNYKATTITITTLKYNTIGYNTLQHRVRGTKKLHIVKNLCKPVSNINNEILVMKDMERKFLNNVNPILLEIKELIDNIGV